MILLNFKKLMFSISVFGWHNHEGLTSIKSTGTINNSVSYTEDSVCLSKLFVSYFAIVNSVVFDPVFPYRWFSGLVFSRCAYVFLLNCIKNRCSIFRHRPNVCLIGFQENGVFSGKTKKLGTTAIALSSFCPQCASKVNFASEINYDLLLDQHL